MFSMRVGSSGVVVTLALGLLFAAPVSRAAAPWSEPALVPGEPPTPAEQVGNQTPALVAMTAAGRAVVGMGRSLSPLLSDGRPGPTVTRQAQGVLFTDILGYGRDRLLAIGGTTDANGAWTPVSRAVVSFGTADGRLGEPVPVDARRDLRPPQAAAVNGAGGAALAVSSADPRGTTSLELYVRSPGGAFRAAFRVERARSLGRPSVAINRGGDVLLAWRRDRSLYARVRRASGRLGPVQRLGPSGYAGYVSTTIDDTGRAAVAWLSQSINEGSLTTPIVVSLAYASPGRAFGRRQVVESVPQSAARWYVPYPGLEVALVRDRGVLAWTGLENGHFVVRAADIAHGRITARQVLARPHPAKLDSPLFSDLAVGSRGAVLVAWGGTAAGAAVRGPAAARFGAAESIDTALSESDRLMPRVSVDPVLGRAIAIWGFWRIPSPPGEMTNLTRYAIRAPIDAAAP
jgi:hypothetical protein